MSEENINEREAFYASGWLILVLWLLALGSMIVLFVGRVMHGAEPPLGVFLGVAVLFFLTKGFVILPPNIAGVLTFFGRYAGTIRPSEARPASISAAVAVTRPSRASVTTRARSRPSRSRARSADRSPRG